MTTPRYCTNCGAALTVENRFCGQCGQAVAAIPDLPPARPAQPEAPAQIAGGPTPSPPLPGIPTEALVQPTPASPAEPILGIVTVGKSKGLMGMRHDSYNMIVTSSRLVFAYVSPQLMKAAVKQAREEAKQEGKGLLRQWGAQLAWLSVLERQYQTMTMDAVLRQYPGSFVVANHQVRRVRYRRNRDDEDGQTHDELILRTDDGKLRFKLLTGNLRQVKQLLRQALGGA